jgi:predicted TIM-barrel enzyme
MPVYAVDYKKANVQDTQFINVIAPSFDDAVKTFRAKNPAATVVSCQDAGLYIRAAQPAVATHVSQEGKVLKVSGIKTGNLKALLTTYPSRLGIHSAIKAELTKRGVRV